MSTSLDVRCKRGFSLRMSIEETKLARKLANDQRLHKFAIVPMHKNLYHTRYAIVHGALLQVIACLRHGLTTYRLDCTEALLTIKVHLAKLCHQSCDIDDKAPIVMLHLYIATSKISV